MKAVEGTWPGAGRGARAQAAIPRSRNFAVFPELIGRLRAITNYSAWLREFAAALVHNCVAQPELLEIAELLLFGVVTASSGERRVAPKSGTINVIFDLSDTSRFECRVAGSRMTEFYLNRLQAASVDDEALTRGVCSLSGNRDVLEHTFPEPTLPVIGATYLFSMFDEVPSLLRDGVTGAKIFPVSRTPRMARLAAHKLIPWRCWGDI